MKLYIATIDITCGEYDFLDHYLIVAKNLKEAEKIAEEYVKEENAMYPGETHYKLNGIDELKYIDGYKINSKLFKI